MLIFTKLEIFWLLKFQSPILAPEWSCRTKYCNSCTTSKNSTNKSIKRFIVFFNLTWSCLTFHAESFTNYRKTFSQNTVNEFSTFDLVYYLLIQSIITKALFINCFEEIFTKHYGGVIFRYTFHWINNYVISNSIFFKYSVLFKL